MGLNDIKILRQNGGVPATLPGEDHYSGLIFYADDAQMPTPNSGVAGFSTTNRIIQISTIEYAESLGITPAAAGIIPILHYHLREAFRINPGIMLWVGIFNNPIGIPNFKEIKTMQIFASGKIRQIGVYLSTVEFSSGQLAGLQGISTELEENYMPLSILYSPKITSISSLTSSASIGLKNVSVLIGQSGDSEVKDLFDTHEVSVGIVGNALGMLSKMSVHESIAWVAKCPTGIDIPAFSDGTLLKTVDIGVVNTLNDNRFIFLRTFGGMVGSFYNDSFTMDIQTSDYNAIERVRTMDKACRGIRTYLLPHLNSPLYVDPATGMLEPNTVAFLQNEAGRALEDMERVGELSGYVVEINPNQNVLASSMVEIVIRQVPVGVMRKIQVKIGFTTKI